MPAPAGQRCARHVGGGSRRGVGWGLGVGGGARNEQRGKEPGQQDGFGCGHWCALGAGGGDGRCGGGHGRSPDESWHEDIACMHGRLFPGEPGAWEGSDGDRGCQGGAGAVIGWVADWRLSEDWR